MKPVDETMNKHASNLTEEMAEVLEAVWTLEENNQASLDAVQGEATVEISPALLEALQGNHLITVEGAGLVRLLPEGRRVAEKIIRRHRLAERLICDVLGSGVEESEAAACEFEHLLAEGITSSICTLLGHPRFCPHNRPIPEGACCRKAREELRPIVVSADMMEVGTSAQVAYLCTREHGSLQKLSAFGIAPGASIRLLQKRPSYVFRCEETEIALEKEIARNLYVWQTPQEP